MKNLFFSVALMMVGVVGFAKTGEVQVSNCGQIQTIDVEQKVDSKPVSCSTRTETTTTTRGGVSTTTTTTVVTCDTPQEMADYNKAVGIH